MNTASIAEIKKKVLSLQENKLAEVCLLLAKYKKDNKEYLSYLLFDADNEAGFIESVKTEANVFFSEINKSNLYLAKKTIRKILKYLNRHIAYSGKVQTQIELLIYFCEGIKKTKLDLSKSAVLENLYRNQLLKIKKAMGTLHEDLQYDYQKEVDKL